MSAPKYRLLDPLIVLLPCAFYSLGYFYWYSFTPLGLVPVLDGRENIELAQAMANGSLAAEPFYRAPLYPYILSLLVQVGLPAEDLPIAARLINACLHLVNTWLTFRIARNLWQSRGAGIVAGLLLGLNPVLLHFASDPLDITLGRPGSCSVWPSPCRPHSRSVHAWASFWQRACVLPSEASAVRTC